MTNEILYYKYTEAQPPSGTDFELVGHDYHGFLLTRDPTFLLWSIAYPDGSPVPLALRDRRFTDRTETRDAIDRYLKDERTKQEASEAKKKT